MTQLSILSGIYADGRPDFRTSYPVNLVPVPKDQGISAGYLRPADGIVKQGSGSGIDRGAIAWNGTLYRVLGNDLVKIAADGTATRLGDIAGTGYASFAYSFDYLAVCCDGNAYLCNPGPAKITDTDLGKVFSVTWIDGYFIFTDGTSLIATDLNNPGSVNPLHYGSSEVNPDPVVAVTKLRNELVAVNRYSIEFFQDIGGTGFPFERINGAYIPKGAVGSNAQCIVTDDTLAFVGGGVNDPPSVYVGGNGQAACIATREIEAILAGYTDDQLSTIVVEYRADQAQRLILIHCPDQTLAYDMAGSQALQQPVWFILQSGWPARSKYRARGHVWLHGRWNVADSLSGNYGYLSPDIATHWGAKTSWEFATALIYNEGAGAIVHELELITLSGAKSKDTIIETQYTLDGVKWSQPKAIKARGRIKWLQQGMVRNWRAQKFTGDSDAQASFARLEARLEPLAF
jgi:hypothetical protein